MAKTSVSNWLAPLRAPKLRGPQPRWRFWRRRLAVYLAIIGPGVITSSVNQDAGGIYTYSLAGARFGYLLLWTVIPMGIAHYVTMEMSDRLGIVTGKGLSDLIREEFGFRTTFFLMMALLAVNLGNILAEFAGVAAALSLFGISKFVSVPAAALLVWGVVLWGNYKTVEKIFLVGCVFYLSYIVSAFLAEPDWLLAGYHTVRPTIEWNATYLLLVVGLVGSTIAPWQFFYLQAGVVERGMRPADRWRAHTDLVSGTVALMVTIFCIILACAATLHQAGILNLRDAADAAHALRPLAGEYAYLLFAVGLLMASLLAASIVPLSTAYSICEGLGVEASLDRPFREAPMFYSLYTALIVVGAGLILIPGTPLVRVIVLSQVVNGFLLPVILIFLLALVNRRDLMGEWRNTRRRNVISWLTAAIMIVLTLLLLGLLLTGHPVVMGFWAG